MVNLGAALLGLSKIMQPLIVDQIREEIITTYRQATNSINIKALESEPGTTFDYLMASLGPVE
jgi:hypothetical protein